jgi:HK97 family phage portal protein
MRTTNGVFSRILEGAQVRLGKLIDDGWFWKSLRLRAAEGDGKLTSPVSQIASVYASVSRIASLLSSIPFQVVTGPGDSPVVLDPKTNEIARLFRFPNASLPSRSTLWEVTVFQRMLRGGSYWVLTGPNGSRLASDTAVPSMIFPIPGTSMRKVVDEKTGMIVQGYELLLEGGKKIRYQLHEVIPLRFHDPFKPATDDFAPLDVAKMSIEQDHAAKRWNWALFQNYCQPSGIVTMEGTALPEERGEIKAEIRDAHQGVEKQYDVAVLPLGAKWEKTSDSAKDMQFLELLKFSALEVYEVFGVNKFVVGDVEELNFASALVAERQVYRNRVIPETSYYSDVLEPYLERWSNGTARPLWDTSGVEALKQGFTETLLQATSLKALGYDLNDDQADEDEEASFSPERVERIAQRAYWRAFNARALEPFEKAMVKKLRRILFDLQKETLSNLAAVTAEEGKGLESVSERILNPDIDRILYDEGKAAARIQRALEPIFEDIFLEALATLGEDLGGLSIVDAKDADLLEFLLAKQIRVTRISETVRERIRKSLAKAINDKATVQQITERIRKQFKFARARSLTIARTETAQTSSGVRFLAMKKEGISRHRWIPANDDEVRESHARAQLDPEAWTVKVGTQFPNGLTHPSEVGGPAEEVINCRCVAVPVVEDN